MKTLQIFFLAFGVFISSQNIQGIQLFNPYTNDETPVFKMNQQFILRFDDLTNRSHVYRYTIKHYDRNWQEDHLFFTEIANGSMNGLIDQFQYSFNTIQPYTHYVLKFPNEKMQPKISGNFEIIVFKDSADKPLFTRRFSLVEDQVSVLVSPERVADARRPEINQRVEVRAASRGADISSNINSMSLTVQQNNNTTTALSNLRPSSSLGNQLLFQQLTLAFPGNNEFYYFDNKNLNMAADMVREAGLVDGQNHTILHSVWAYPLNYQYQPDVNGAWYYRRNDLGIERNADREADYSWVHFSIDSESLDKEIHVLGGFNDFLPNESSKMIYDESTKKYVAKIYLKQGFYNYILATKDQFGVLNFGEINGNFWQTENLYQAFLYYRPFGRNYDGLIGYGEYRTPVR